MRAGRQTFAIQLVYKTARKILASPTSGRYSRGQPAERSKSEHPPPAPH